MIEIYSELDIENNIDDQEYGILMEEAFLTYR